MVAGVLLEPYMSQEGQGVTETPIVSKGLKNEVYKILKYLKWMSVEDNKNHGQVNVHKHHEVHKSEIDSHPCPWLG